MELLIQELDKKQTICLNMIVKDEAHIIAKYPIPAPQTTPRTLLKHFLMIKTFLERFLTINGKILVIIVHWP